MFEVTALFALAMLVMGVMLVFAVGLWLLKVALKVVFLPFAFFGFALKGLVLLVAVPVALAVVLGLALPLVALAVVAVPLLLLGLLVWGGVAVLSAAA